MRHGFVSRVSWQEEEESPIIRRPRKKAKTRPDLDSDNEAGSACRRGAITPGADSNANDTEMRSSSGDALGECAICQDTVGSNGGVAIMPCPSGKRFEKGGKRHKFCLGCIKDWAKAEDTCPLCREKFERIAIIHQVCRERG